MSTRVKNIIGTVLSVASVVAVYVFGPSGPWAHVAAGGIVIAILTDLKKITGQAS